MNFRRLSLILVAFCMIALPAFSGELQDWEFNINGTDYYPAGGATFATVPGLNASGFNTTTSLGTFTITFSPGKAGSYYVGGWFFDPVATPFYNEYGVVNGSPVAGEQWEIGIPEYDATSAHLGTGTLIDDLVAGSLDDTNGVTGTLSNYLLTCGANTPPNPPNTACNDLVSMALGFSFTLTKTQSEYITFTLSSTNPGGFSIEDAHPVDGSNPGPAPLAVTNLSPVSAAIFLQGSAAITAPPPPPTVPEPSTWLLLVSGGAFLAAGMRRRLVKR